MLHPTVDRGVIDMQAPLEHHLLQISVAQWIPQVPADTQQNNLGLEVTPFERLGGIHECRSSQFSEYRRVYSILAIFATRPDVGTVLCLARHGAYVPPTDTQYRPIAVACRCQIEYGFCHLFRLAEPAQRNT